MPKKATEAKSNAAAPAPAPEKEADVPSSKATSAAPAPVPRSQTKPKPAPADEMHLSAERGDVGRLAELLSVPGADIDAAAHGGLTPLMCCASKGRCGAAQLLLRFGATIAATDESGFTALHWASAGGHRETVEILLRFGATTDAVDNGGNTAFHVGCRRAARRSLECGETALLKALIDAGSDPQQRNSNGHSGLELMSGAGRAAAQRLQLLQLLGCSPLDPPPTAGPEPPAAPAVELSGRCGRPAAGGRLVALISHTVDTGATAGKLRQALADSPAGAWLTVLPAPPVAAMGSPAAERGRQLAAELQLSEADLAAAHSAAGTAATVAADVAAAATTAAADVAAAATTTADSPPIGDLGEFIATGDTTAAADAAGAAAADVAVAAKRVRQLQQRLVSAEQAPGRRAMDWINGLGADIVENANPVLAPSVLGPLPDTDAAFLLNEAAAAAATAAEVQVDHIAAPSSQDAVDAMAPYPASIGLSKEDSVSIAASAATLCGLALAAELIRRRLEDGSSGLQWSALLAHLSRAAISDYILPVLGHTAGNPAAIAATMVVSVELRQRDAGHRQMLKPGGSCGVREISKPGTEQQRGEKKESELLEGGVQQEEKKEKPEEPEEQEEQEEPEEQEEQCCDQGHQLMPFDYRIWRAVVQCDVVLSVLSRTHGMDAATARIYGMSGPEAAATRATLMCAAAVGRPVVLLLRNSAAPSAHVIELLAAPPAQFNHPDLCDPIDIRPVPQPPASTGRASHHM